jgi:diguanylate cyclase (GGDEF)-like protein
MRSPRRIVSGPMSSDPKPATAAAPDRLFARTTAIGLAAALAIVLTGHLLLDRTHARESRAAELAIASAGETAAARAVLATLQRLAAQREGAAGDAAAIRLGWDVDRLVALDARRLDLAPGPAAALAEIAAATRPAPAGAEARALADRLETRLLPQLDRIAAESERAALEARGRSRLVLLALLAFQVAACAVLFLGVAQPARRRVEDWMAETAEADRENRFRLLHDTLTGLPNAAFFHAHLTRLAAGAGRAAGQTAVLRVDLDRFRGLREALGARTGDEVIRLAARRIRRALRAGDFAAFLGQDGFVVVAPELDETSDAAMIAGRVQTALEKPFAIRGGAQRLTCSVGVTFLSDDRPESERALANAGIALCAARAAGPGAVRYFREDLRREVERREALCAALMLGLERGEVVAFFQPQVELATGAFAGFEALVRWRNPDHGLLEPEAFLGFAEQTDLGERIGELVLTRALEALNAWDAAGLAAPRVGVNFGLAQLCDPRLVEKIKWETERLGVEPARVAIEVLETVLIKTDGDMVVRNLRGLASAGFHVELDDFGTGHASIANLRRFMVNRIKIDRGFVTGIETSEEQRTLTASMIAMAHALGIATLAEGVETEAARATLAHLGCDAVQGYLVGRPMPLADTLPWLAAFPGQRAAP